MRSQAKFHIYMITTLYFDEYPNIDSTIDNLDIIHYIHEK